MKKGFTLIELLVVVLIIGILAAIALPQYTTSVEKSRASEALTLLGTLAHSGERYYMQMSSWPDDFAALDIETPGTAVVNDTSKKTTSFSTNTFNYTFGTEGTGVNAKWVVNAERSNGATPYTTATGPTYKLTVKIGADGAITRSCTVADTKYCKAISSGNPTSF